MRTLRLVALSDDGTSLVLTTEGADGLEGERFELPIDERVRAAARGDARLGAIEDVGNTLPPRVIQARIRSGETPEQVAQASGTRVERIMRFAHPVLQERARIAEQARDCRVRLSEGTTTTSLERFMSGRLRLLGADLDGVRWDAFRSDDGAWLVTAAWTAGAKSGVTHWAYDIPARTVTPLDAATMDFAEGTRLVRVVPDVPEVPPAGPAPTAPERPVTALPDAGPTDGDDQPAAEHVRHVVPDDGVPGDRMTGDRMTGDRMTSDGVPSNGVPPQPGSRFTDVPFLDDDPAEHDTVVLGRPDDAEDPRARVPAWEDIVFGVRRHR